MPTNQKHAKIALLIVITFVLLAVVLITIVIAQRPKFRRENTQQAAIEQQKSEDAIAAEKGYIKMISGNVDSLNSDQGIIIVDIDPLGAHKKYEIITNQSTVFEKMGADQTMNSDQQMNMEEGHSAVSAFRMKSSEAKYPEIKEGQFVEVYFPKRVANLERTSSLVAEKVVMYEYNN